MISVQDTFICKPGNASKMAKMFKEYAEITGETGYTIMTDMTGQFHRVIIAWTYSDLAAYEQAVATMGQSDAEKKAMEKFKDMNEMYGSGSREIFKIW